MLRPFEDDSALCLRRCSRDQPVQAWGGRIQGGRPPLPYLPLPEILVGLRIAIGVGWTTLVAAEMVAATVRKGRRCRPGLIPA